MEASTTIRRMMAGNSIVVPTYQRAYSWDTPLGKTNRTTHTDVFLSDLEEHGKSDATSPYYFGHFLFEKKDHKYYVIDGQQRLTTIVIFLSALFARLRELRKLSEEEEVQYEDMVMRRSTIRFSTVDYDNQLFIDYVIEQTKTDHNNLDTESARRIVRGFDFFKQQLLDKPDGYLTRMLSLVSEAACSTHLVQNESEAIQMFIFQNNRGKKPSNLEIVKAQFMYHIHLYGNHDKDALVTEIKNRFEEIYKSISTIEYRIGEDDVLLYTLRVYFNSLWESNALERIDKELSSKNPIDFIKAFSQSLSSSFQYLCTFFGKHEQENISIHSLITLGGIGIVLPFIIKAYQYDLTISDIGTLCASLESLILRHRLIGTRAEITSRINDVFEKFTRSSKDIRPIVNRINWMKTTSEWWWAYWNNERLKDALQGEIKPAIARYLLWKYEVHLETKGEQGYTPTRFDRITKPELEHIAPISEPAQKPHGYGEYDDEFRRQHLNCLGNYLLLSKSHNCAVGNIPFVEKWRTYTHNEQQREIQRLVSENGLWEKDVIQRRKNAIVSFILCNL